MRKLFANNCTYIIFAAVVAVVAVLLVVVGSIKLLLVVALLSFACRVGAYLLSFFY